ncbi:MAG: hypothetical protein ACKVOR_14495 [Flavobacteriales bacterium]
MALLVFATTIATGALAQQWWQRIEVNAGAGASVFEKLYVIRNSEFPEATIKNWNQPAWCAGMGYRLGKNFSLGLSGGQQAIGQDIENLDISIDDETLHFDLLKYRITRTNAGLRALVHFPINRTPFELYTGARFGLSFFTVKVDETGSEVVNEFEKRLKFGTAAPSAQWVALGIKYHGLNYVGIYAEVGLGAPAFAQAGICIRLADMMAFAKAQQLPEPKL